MSWVMVDFTCVVLITVFYSSDADQDHDYDDDGDEASVYRDALTVVLLSVV